MTDEAELTEMLQAIDGRVAIDDAASQRIQERMLWRLESAEHIGTTGTVPPSVKTPKLRWFAAISAVAAAVAIIFLMADRGVESVEVTNPVTAIVTPDAGEPTPTAAERSLLGYELWTNVSFRTTLESGSWVTDRLSYDETTDVFTLRRQVDNSVLSPSVPIVSMVLTDETNGVGVPVEFLDPVGFGGPCVGGLLLLGISAPAAQSTVATCGGIETALEYTFSVRDEDRTFAGQTMVISVIEFRSRGPAVDRSGELLISPTGLIGMTYSTSGLPEFLRADLLHE